MQSATADAPADDSSLSVNSDRWLTRFRYAVIGLIALHIIGFLVAIPLDYRALVDDIATSDVAGQLARAGVSDRFFTNYMTGAAALSGLTFIALGMLILLRRSDAFMPLFVALVLVVEGAQINGLFYALDSIGRVGGWIAHSADAFSSTLLAIFFFTFPTGRFTPHWTRWAAVVVAIIAAVEVVLAIRAPLTDYTIATLLLLGSIFGVMVYAQVHRYRWVCTQKERQQVKWVVVGMIVAVTIFATAAVATVLFPDRGPIAIMFWFTLVNIGLLMIPITITVAILRYQLLDIDQLINRTLVYTCVTAVLGAVYASSAMILQLGLDFVAGSSALAVAGSTVLAVVLFKPVRDWVQRSVDRRFYRTRYDVDDVLTQFSVTIRDEVELERVQHILADTIDSAVRPSKMSIWLLGSGTSSAGISAESGQAPQVEPGGSLLVQDRQGATE